MTRVFLIAETQEQAAELTGLLAEEERFEIVGSTFRAAEDGGDWEEEAAFRPDVALVASDGASADFPFADVPVVLLTNRQEGWLERWSERGNIRARLPVTATAADIVAALLAVSQGMTVLTQSQAESLLPASGALSSEGAVASSAAGAASGSVARPARASLQAPVETLTPRELQVLRMLAEGLGNKEIAGQLGISDHTAKFHVASILGKLHAQTRTEAVTLGIRLGLVPI